MFNQHSLVVEHCVTAQKQAIGQISAFVCPLETPVKAANLLHKCLTQNQIALAKCHDVVPGFRQLEGTIGSHLATIT